MDFLIADTFADALARLSAQDQKAVKTNAFDLQLDPSAPGFAFHRIDHSKDPNFWSIRVNRDIRIIVHRTPTSLLLAYVDHHDRAYAWAERRRIEAHPRTGAVQIVEVRERVEEIGPVATVGGRHFEALPTAAPAGLAEAPTPFGPPAALLFSDVSSDDLLLIGVPEDWLADVHAASEARFYELAQHLPAEAAEALLDYAATGTLRRPGPSGAAAAAFAHPDAQRRFRTVESQAELQQALDFPWEKWTIFLHPAQRGVVERDFARPARVAGSAGTGKTVVALHRAARLARGDGDVRLLLTTFSRPLANALQRKLAILSGPQPGIVPRITVAPWRGVAEDHQLAFGRRPHVASDALLRGLLEKAAEAQGATGVTARFLMSEWTHVVDAWQIADAEAYAAVPRLGRKSRIGARQRDRLWPVFAATRAALAARGLDTWPGIFSAVAAHFAGGAPRPFTHIVVDEAQDLGVAELRFLAAIAPDHPNALFFAGDLGQRIFQQPFSWRALGVDVRGRSQTLKINYRTSHQIRQMADRLLPGIVRDVDGMEEERRGTVSVFDGPEPTVALPHDAEAEIALVARFVSDAVADGILPGEISLFVRTTDQLPRARAVAAAAGQTVTELSEGAEDPAGRLAIGTMHLAKGLEFKAVAVMACDDEVLPLQARVETVADEVELDDVYETERQLFYVACTRARDRLLVSGVAPGSEFLADIRNGGGSKPKVAVPFE